MVELTEAVDEFGVYLDVGVGSELNWGKLYLGFGLLGTLVSGLVALGVFPFSLLSPVAYLFLFGLTVLAVGGVHTYRRSRGLVGDGKPPDRYDDPGTSRLD